MDHSRSSAKTYGCASRSFSAPFPEGRALCLYFHHRAIVGRLSNPTLSQIGMVAHWWKKEERGARVSMAVNGLGELLLL